MTHFVSTRMVKKVIACNTSQNIAKRAFGKFPFCFHIISRETSDLASSVFWMGVKWNISKIQANQKTTFPLYFWNISFYTHSKHWTGKIGCFTRNNVKVIRTLAENTSGNILRCMRAIIWSTIRGETKWVIYVKTVAAHMLIAYLICSPNTRETGNPSIAAYGKRHLLIGWLYAFCIVLIIANTSCDHEMVFT